MKVKRKMIRVKKNRKITYLCNEAIVNVKHHNVVILPLGFAFVTEDLLYK